MKRAGAALVLWILAVGVPSADMPAPVLVLPGSPEKTITSQSLRGPGKTDVLQESEQGGATTYRGMPLLEVLEKNGLDVGGMPSQRKIASAVVVAQGRDGYTVVFSIGELLLHRSDPKVFLVAETAEGPLSGDQGPIRLIAVGQRARSAFGLAKIELRYLGDNKPMPKP